MKVGYTVTKGGYYQAGVWNMNRERIQGAQQKINCGMMDCLPQNIIMEHDKLIYLSCLK